MRFILPCGGALSLPGSIIRRCAFSGLVRPAFEEGIEQHDVDGIPMRVYSPEKTLADCFKYRNKIGLDVVLEALKFYRQRKRFKVDELMHYAKVCRVERVMRPYVEATL